MIHEYKVTNSGFFSIKNHKILKKNRFQIYKYQQKIKELSSI